MTLTASGRLSADLRKCTSTVGVTITRAAGYAAVSLLALLSPVFEGGSLVAFALVAIVGAVATDGPVFDFFADRGEFKNRRLLGLIEYAIAASVLAAGVVLNLIPVELFAGTVLLVGFGYFGAEMARLVRSDRLTETTGFITIGFMAFAVGHLAGTGLSDADPAAVGTLAMAGALMGALFRAVVWARHDGLMMLVLAVILGGLLLLPFPSVEIVGLAIVISIILAYLALMIGVASVAGMATGVLMVFLTIVYGGLEWVTMLIAFFGIGGIATKYRYVDKRSRGVAEANRGARGTGNVLGNTLVALAAVIGYAAVTGEQSAQLFFSFAFAGALATALSDTLSSEFGSLYDNPLLITSLDRVAPGTDGAVTLPGTVAGAIGAGLIAALFVAFGPAGLIGGFVILAAGTVGMLVDSMLGAVIEGEVIGNHGVNAMATLAGASIAAVGALIGLV